MDGIIIINKEKNMTSRDVVNVLSKSLNTKKIGHTGTLDPIARGVLVVCIGKATKLVEELTCNDKEYIATVEIGTLTDTLDITGNIVEKRNCVLSKERLLKVLNSFVGKYNQEVPIYSAVKIKGKKLYEYARNNEEVKLPKREVEIKNIELLECNNNEYKFKVCVSKGTYIRSLIKDINDKLDIIGSMSDLVRTRQGIFKIEDAYSLKDIEDNNYNILSIEDIYKKEEAINIDEELYKKIKNGSIIDNIYNKEKVIFMYNNKIVSIYKIYEKDKTKMKPYKMFI